jgi:hypothetical protein
MQWELLEQPVYSLDFTPHGFLIFGPLKKALEGSIFIILYNTMGMSHMKVINQVI